MSKLQVLKAPYPIEREGLQLDWNYLSNVKNSNWDTYPKYLHPHRWPWGQVSIDFNSKNYNGVINKIDTSVLGLGSEFDNAYSSVNKAYILPNSAMIYRGKKYRLIIETNLEPGKFKIYEFTATTGRSASATYDMPF